MGKKKKDVLVTKPSKKAKKEAGDSGWVSMKDSKSKMVSQKRADRMSKRGWQQSHKMGDSPANMNGDPEKKKLTKEVKLGSSARPGQRTGNTEFKPLPLEPYAEKIERFEFAKMKKASPAKMTNSWEEHDVKEGRKQMREGHKGHAEALFDDAHGSWNWNKSHHSTGAEHNSPAHMSDELSYGGPVIDKEPGALSHMGAHKVLKHMKGRM